MNKPLRKYDFNTDFSIVILVCRYGLFVVVIVFHISLFACTTF